MRRFVYITILAVLTVTAITAQSPDEPVAIELPAVDSAAVSVSLPDSDTVVQPAPVRNRRPRYASPVNNAATRTQYHNDAAGDTARMIERRRQRSVHYHDEDGRTVMVDTVTGQEWVDSTEMPKPPKMKNPLMFALEVGVDIWDPMMRLFGQEYGGIGFSLGLNLHNRYIPTFETGFGMANATPEAMNFTYKTPLAPYFKIGADYNFVYNSDPAYRFVVGLRYGFSAFSYSLSNVTFDVDYWDQHTNIEFPSQNVTAGWLEVVAGLRVKLFGPISAGWMVRYHSILHQTKVKTGDPWYIPGYGSSASTITATFSFFYDFRFKHRTPEDYEAATDVGNDADAFLLPPVNDSISEPNIADPVIQEL